MTTTIERTDRPDLIVFMEPVTSSQQIPIGLTGEGPRVIVRMRQPELGRALRQRSQLRTNYLLSGGNPCDFAAALEIDVLIADEASVARTEMRRLDEHFAGETTRYVGTAGGLITLIRDIYAAEVADAVIVYPIGGDHTVSLLNSHVLPALSR